MKKFFALIILIINGVVMNAQSVKWLQSSGGAYGPQIRDLAVDKAGFIYAVGFFNTNLTVNGNAVNTKGGYDVFITKYAPNGDLIWIKTIGGGSTDLGFEIETDQQDKVYVSVFCQSSSLTVSDSVLTSAVSGILRFDSTGKFEAVLTTGMTVYNMKIYKNFIYARTAVNNLFKANLDGGIIWTKSISGSFASNQLLITTPATSLEITPHGNLIFSQSCTGNYSYGGTTVNNSSGSFVVASLVDTNSNLIKNYSWGMNEGFTLGARSAIVDQNHNVYLAANFPVSYTNTFGSSTILHLLSGSSFHALLKFDSAAAPVWAFHIACANSSSNFYDLELDHSGNIALLGMYGDIPSLGGFGFPTNMANGNIFTATVNPAGSVVAAMGFGTNNSTDRASDLELLSDSSFVMGGFTGTTAPVKYGCINAVNAGFMVLKYSYDVPPLPEVSFTSLREQRKVFFTADVRNATKATWDFGDGTTSTQGNPTHIYATPGNFAVRLVGSNSCGTDTFTTNIRYDGIQKVVSRKIANNRLQMVFVKGGFPFKTGQMTLKKGAHILLSETMAVNDSGVVQGNFLLHNEPIGLYDVIINSGSFTDTLYNGVELEPENNDSLTIQISGPQKRLINRFQRYQVTVSNPGNINQFGIPVLIALHPKTEIGQLSNYIISDAHETVVRDSAFTHDFIMVKDAQSGDSMWISLLILPVVTAHSTEMIEFYMRGKTLGDKPMVVSLFKPMYSSPQLVQLGLMKPATSCDFFADPFACVLDILGQVPLLACGASSLSLGCSIGNAARDIVGNRNKSGNAAKYISDGFNLTSDIVGVLTCEAPPGKFKEKAKEVAEDAVLEVANELLGISASLLIGDKPNVSILKLAGLPITIPGPCISAFGNIAKGDQKNWIIKDVSSMDPNDKTGPVGLTPENYFDGQSTMQFKIRFENVSTATAPASEVEIVDSLDAGFFDIQSLRFTGFGFADSAYQLLNATESYVQEIDLRPAKNTIVRFRAILDTISNLIRWKFESLDPVSRQPVADVDDGFLNPNQNSPEGEGFVSFSILPLPNRPHLQQVSNKAKIVFDDNAPIFTNAWINTVDKGKPASQVQPLPVVYNDTIFTVSWTGTDPHAGMMAYDIYVTINDTATRLLMRNTRADSVTISGVIGSTYKFYSVAIDQVGNIETPPGAPDAVITLAAPLPLHLLSFSGSKQQHDGVLQWRTANEINVSHFEVQRSNDGQHFETIGRVQPGGNAYAYTDAAVFPGKSLVFYRLKLIDRDGRFNYSSIIRLSSYALLQLTVSPNPVQEQVSISGLKQNGTIRVLGMEGKVLHQQTITTQSITIDMSRYAKGMYLLQYLHTGETVNQKIMKQ